MQVLIQNGEKRVKSLGFQGHGWTVKVTVWRLRKFRELDCSWTAEGVWAEICQTTY